MLIICTDVVTWCGCKEHNQYFFEVPSSQISDDVGDLVALGLGGLLLVAVVGGHDWRGRSWGAERNHNKLGHGGSGDWALTDTPTSEKRAETRRHVTSRRRREKLSHANMETDRKEGSMIKIHRYALIP